MLKVKKIKPMFNSLLTTMNKYDNDTIVDGIITKSSGGLKEYQEVLAVGSTIRDIKVGDVVWINPIRFAVKKHKEGSLKDGIVTDNPVVSYNFDVVEVNGNPCLLLQDRDIDFVIEDYEETSDVIIQPEQPKIII